MIATYDGSPIEVMIASETNPWVEVDGKPYDWMTEEARFLPQVPGNECDSCFDCPVAGTLPAMDTPEGIQRCDECQRFDGDLDAALALAGLIGGVVRFEVEEDE